MGLFTNPNSVTITVNGTSSNANDRIVVAGLGIRYPSLPQFNNARMVVFELDSSNTPLNLELTQLNTGGLQPILFDETNGIRMIGEITSTPGKIKFELSRQRSV